ncbi:hypothetical protein LCGC14_1792080 [marine sediment metagenome]|uniref:Uncharacterized protein n=1 Tax=marine sediment metagenome TaxID=412755 RepID=A0A0F9JRQ8_9ZZZZ
MDEKLRYKEINKIDADMKFIKSQIDSFTILINNKEKIDANNFKDELETFISLIPAQGHLVKLNNDYQGKFFNITKFVKDTWDVGITTINLRR